MKKVLITGASGFLGSCLIDHLLTRRGSYCLYVLTGKEETLKYKYRYSSIHVLNKDFIFNQNISDIINNSYIVNCAYPRNTDGISIANGLNYLNRLFNVVNNFKAKAIINISSQSVYNQKRLNIADETSSIDLGSMYAIGKYAVELLLNNICRDVVHTNLRMSSLIGPTFDQRVTNKIVDDAIEKNIIKVSKSQKRFGFMDVDDAADAIIALLDTETSLWKPVYTVGIGNNGYDLIDISKKVLQLSYELMHVSIKIQCEEIEDFGNTAVSCRLFGEDTGFYPSRSLEDSLRKIFESKLYSKKN